MFFAVSGREKVFGLVWSMLPSRVLLFDGTPLWCFCSSLKWLSSRLGCSRCIEEVALSFWLEFECAGKFGLPRVRLLGGSATGDGGARYHEDAGEGPENGQAVVSSCRMRRSEGRERPCR